MTSSCKNIAIIGAGIIGVSTALWLQKAGHKVTLIDKQGVAAGTSYGNAGLLASCAIVPVPVPGLLKKAPFMLLDKNAPLFMRWPYLPKLMPFLWRFLKSGNLTQVHRISDALTSLLHDSVAQHQSLAKGTGAEKYIHESDYIFGYPSQKALDQDALAWQIRAERGYDFAPLSVQEYTAFDPAMGQRFAAAMRCGGHGYINDPGAYIQTLARHIENCGGHFMQAEVRDIKTPADKALTLITNKGPLEADELVLCAGIWSGPLAKKLGLTIPLESERGYHIEFINPSITPKAPVMVMQGKFVMTPMQGRLRCAGIVEFAGLNAPPSRAPFELLKRQALELLPELSFDRIDEWMGHRPSTTDSLPVIGPLKTKTTAHKPNIWLGFGHQHIGLTAGAKTGRWLAQMIDQHTPNADLTPFRPDRFEKR